MIFGGRDETLSSPPRAGNPRFHAEENRGKVRRAR